MINDVKRIKEPSIIIKLLYPFFQSIDFILIYLFNKKEKEFLFLFMKKTEERGTTPVLSVTLKYNEYIKRKKWILAYFLKKCLNELEKGNKLVDALRKSKIINRKEYMVLTKARDFSSGIEQINNEKNKAKKSMIGFFLLLLPSLGILAGLLLTHDLVHQILLDMSAPYKSMGAKAPPIPYYLADPYIYTLANVLVYTILIIFIIMIYFLKRISPKLYFKIFPIWELEYTQNILYNIYSLKKAGISLSESLKILLDGENDVIKYKIYKNISKDLKAGEINVSKVFENYGINYTTISLVKISEITNSFDDGMKMALEEIEERYDKTVKLFLKLTFFIGQMLMFVVMIKPMVDILLLTSVNQMNFQLN